MRISDWSSDVCSSDLLVKREFGQILVRVVRSRRSSDGLVRRQEPPHQGETDHPRRGGDEANVGDFENAETLHPRLTHDSVDDEVGRRSDQGQRAAERSEEHTSELQSLMRNSYAVFGLKQQKHTHLASRLSPYKTHDE